MSPPEKPDEIRFSEWRPIGICDQGGPNERKAIMFKGTELALITAAGVNRDNWESDPQVVKLIHRHTKKLAKMSTMTQQMVRPRVSEIRLVGMELQFSKTPTLNQESEEGRVQLFQIEFVDQGKRKPWFWKMLVGILCVCAVILGISSLWDLNLEDKRSRVVFCASKRSSSTYAAHLNQAQQQLKRYLQQLPPNYRNRCYFNRGTVALKEEQLFTCFLSIQTALSSLQATPDPSLKKVSQCVGNICQKNRAHLQPYCRQLNF